MGKDEEREEKTFEAFEKELRPRNLCRRQKVENFVSGELLGTKSVGP